MLSGKRALKILFLSALVAMGCTHRAEAAMFRVLGSRGGGMVPSSFTDVADVSDDGTTAVGHYSYGSHVGPPRSYLRRWDTDGELLPTAGSYIYPSAVSADGSVLVANRRVSAPDGSSARYEAILVEPDGDVVLLGHLSGGPYNRASGVSGDGSVAVGTSDSESGRRAVRWSLGQTVEMVQLPPLPGGTRSSAAAISADGRIVVGSSDLDASNADSEAVRWSADSTVTGLGRLGDHPTSYAVDVSGDGSVIVGSSMTATLDGPLRIGGLPGDEAFLWTETEGIVGLGFLSGHGWSEAAAISADGRVVVGSSAALFDDGEFTYVGEHEAFIWDAEHGMRNLKDLLADQYGLDMPDWSLGTPTGISADGRVIVGNGSGGGFPLASGGAWMVVIPEPSTLVLIATGLLGWGVLICRKRRLALLSTDGGYAMLSGKRTLKILVLSALVALGCTYRAEAAMFRILGSRGTGMWPSSFTSVSDVSDDGTTAVGH